MAEKKNILTYTGLKKYEDELHDLKVNNPGDRTEDQRGERAGRPV